LRLSKIVPVQEQRATALTPSTGLISETPSVPDFSSGTFAPYGFSAPYSDGASDRI